MLSDIAERFFPECGHIRELLRVGFAVLAVAGEVRPALNREDRELLIEVIEEPTVLIKQVIERLFREPADAGLKSQLRVPPADVHRVELDAAASADVIESAFFADKTPLAEKPLMKEQKTARGGF